MTDQRLMTRTFVDLEFRVGGTSEQRTVEGLVVPFMRPAEITELRETGVISYREQFAPGSFERATRPYNIRRVGLFYGHDDRLSQRLGAALQLREDDAGLYGVFGLDRSTADKAIDVLESSHNGFSIGFLSLIPRAFTERPGELVTRRAAHLDHVAAVATPAYAGAGVALIRGDGQTEEPSAAELAAEQQRKHDRELLDWIDAEKDRWADLR